MLAPEWSLCRLPPFDHQRMGVTMLVNKREFALFDEMGAGKTKQVIDAAQFLHKWGIITRVIVIAPAPVRTVWFDQELGELRKHLWTTNRSTITEYHRRERFWNWIGPEAPAGTPLYWTITNYDFIRDEDRRDELADLADDKTLLVLDESSAVKNHKAIQTQSCIKIRAKCGRVVILNGTPVANHIGDLFSQAFLLTPQVFGIKSYYQFRARYAMLGGWQNKQIIGWRGVEEIQEKLKPYVLRRLKKDCLDLPEKLPPVQLVVPMSAKSWKVYKQMRDDLIAWMSDQTVSVAPQAVVKAMRLAQITSGFIGGLEEAPETEEGPPGSWEDHGPPPDWIPTLPIDPPQAVKDHSAMKIIGQLAPGQDLAWIDTEKIDFFIEWLKLRFEQDENFKLMTWSRFRPEVTRVLEYLGAQFPNVELAELVGGQTRGAREHARRLLDPRTSPKGPAIVVGTPKTGSMGLTMAAAHNVMYLSTDYSHYIRKQSEDRNHRPGQRNVVNYYDLVACGPNGQKTVDHIVQNALLNKQNLADMTCSAWVTLLRQE